MIEFMVLGMPRSGTTWAANWLTTDTTLCLHDPLARYSKEQLDSIESGKTLGTSCTGLGNFPEWLNAHPARKVILHRDAAEVVGSLNDNGFCGYQPIDLDAIRGMHCDWRALWDRPRKIYEFLLEQPFDADRHQLLGEMNVQPDYGRVVFDPSRAKHYVDAMRARL
jgi:hypothetical protein